MIAHVPKNATRRGGVIYTAQILSGVDLGLMYQSVSALPPGFELSTFIPSMNAGWRSPVNRTPASGDYYHFSTSITGPDSCLVFEDVYGPSSEFNSFENIITSCYILNFQLPQWALVSSNSCLVNCNNPQVTVGSNSNAPANCWVNGISVSVVPYQLGGFGAPNSFTIPTDCFSSSGNNTIVYWWQWGNGYNTGIQLQLNITYDYPSPGNPNFPFSFANSSSSPLSVTNYPGFELPKNFHRQINDKRRLKNGKRY